MRLQRSAKPEIPRYETTKLNATTTDKFRELDAVQCRELDAVQCLANRKRYDILNYARQHYQYQYQYQYPYQYQYQYQHLIGRSVGRG